MSRRAKSGFTLVELLVVLAIIGMLAAILIPAVQAARIAARKTQCAANMKSLATAELAYATSKNDRLPGWRNQRPFAGTNTPQIVGWVPPILGNIERGDLYSQYTDTTNATWPTQLTSVEVLVCPAANPQQCLLSYVVNGGLLDADKTNVYGGSYSPPPDYQENGVFFDAVSTQNSNPVTPSTPGAGYNPRGSIVNVGLGYIGSHDGAANTIMLSESNNENLRWNKAGLQSDSTTYSTTVAENTQCIVWTAPDSSSNPIPYPLNQFASNSAYANYPTPSSAHPGGFNVAYFDGGTRWMNSEIDYYVYARLMTPDGAGCYRQIIAGSGSKKADYSFQTLIISDEDIR